MRSSQNKTEKYSDSSSGVPGRRLGVAGRYGGYMLLTVIFLIFVSPDVCAQESDTINTELEIDKDAFRQPVDSMEKDEVAPLDIESDRGLYIRTKDQQMSLRIFGSIRFLILNDFVNTPVKKTFNSYFIPVGDDRVKVPNYYNDLNQSRFGFDVLRNYGDKDLFIRLEMDFNGGPDSRFRIRHAYGKYDRFVIGQTWSLFSNVTALPATVNWDGPTGAVILRTPQIRYFGSNAKGTRWAVALEYSKPELKYTEVDSTNISSVQLIPDLTARIEKEGYFGHVQLSAVINTISVRDQFNEITNIFGIGGSFTGTLEFPTSRILYQMTYGKSIAHFITTFSGTENDAILDPVTGEIEPTWAFGGFLGYDYKWTEKIASNVVFGYAALENNAFQTDNEFSSSYSIGVNSFWNVVAGARMGMEYMYAHRKNKGGQAGGASRISLLFYYDF